MTDISNSPGTGTLVLVVGPSGSGKDSIIEKAKEYFSGDSQIVFPLRLITREDQAGEEHITLTAQEMEKLLREGELFMYWQAHGLQYGIPASVAVDLSAGRTVILNISRNEIAAARERWAKTIVIQVYVRDDILLERLTGRGRETPEEIRARFARRDKYSVEDCEYTIDNSGSLDDAARDFINVVKSCR